MSVPETSVDDDRPATLEEISLAFVEISTEALRLRAQLDAAHDALRQIEKLEARADESVGMVDNPHTKALRAASKIARAALGERQP